MGAAALWCLICVEVMSTSGNVALRTESKPGWFIANVGDNCNDACQKIGLECTGNELKAHNTEVDSSEKLLALLKSLGQEIGVTSCFGTYGRNTDVPLFSKAKKICLHSSSDKENF